MQFFLIFHGLFFGTMNRESSTVLYQLPPEWVICKSIGGYDNTLEDMLHLMRVYLGGERDISCLDNGQKGRA